MRQTKLVIMKIMLIEPVTMTIVNSFDDNYQERTFNASLQRVEINVKVKVCIYLRSIKFKHKENFSYKRDSL